MPSVAHYLSTDWLDQYASVITESESLQGLTRDVPDTPTFVVQQTINEVPDPPGGSSVSFHIIFGPETTQFALGANTTPHPVITFTQDYLTACEITQGKLSAQAAFMAGDLRIGGRVDLLIAHHQVMVELDDAFAELRSSTTW